MSEKIFSSMENLIGNTPLLELSNIERKLDLSVRLIAKLEFFNPAGSVKDRVAKAMIEDAEKQGRLKSGGTVIEPTSGNTGIGLAAVAAVRGYRMIVVMPDSMSEERRKLIQAYGAEIVLTPGADGMKGAIERAESLQKEIPGSIVAGQFENPANPAVHYETTGPEIFEATDGAVDMFVAGVGTGGTITGAGRFLKEKKPGVQLIAVEPSASAVLSGGDPGGHGIQGIGAGFVPKVLDTEIYDEIITVSDKEAYDSARLLAKEEGILAGISSGAALNAAIKISERSENINKMIVVLFPDTGERYLSTSLFS